VDSGGKNGEKGRKRSRGEQKTRVRDGEGRVGLDFAHTCKSFAGAHVNVHYINT